MLDEQGKALIAVTDPLAERCRMLGGSTLHSIAHIARLQRVLDNEAEFVEPQAMLAELREDNRALAAHMRSAHELCSHHRDVATADLLGHWLAEAELRTWFLFEASRDGGSTQRHVLAGRAARTPGLRHGINGTSHRIGTQAHGLDGGMGKATDAAGGWTTAKCWGARTGWAASIGRAEATSSTGLVASAQPPRAARTPATDMRAMGFETAVSALYWAAGRGATRVAQAATGTLSGAPSCSVFSA